MTIARILVLLAVVAVGASAFPTITFNSTGQNVAFGHTGTITYVPTALGGSGTAKGVGIDIDSVTAFQTASNSGTTLKCNFCKLTFETGLNTNDVNLDPHNQSWTFLGGGTFRIVGSIDFNNNGIVDGGEVAGTTQLLAGVFNAPVTIDTATSSIDPNDPNNLTGDLKFISATLINQIHNTIDAFYGLPGTTGFDGLYTQDFMSLRSRYDVTNNKWRLSTYGPTANQTTGMKDGTVVNVAQVPEPVSLLLFGTAGGALALVAARRRRKA